MESHKEGCMTITTGVHGVTVRHRCDAGGCAERFAQSITGLLALPFIGLALFFLVVPLVMGTILEPGVWQSALIFGVPSVFVVWYLMGEMFNAHMLKIERGYLRRYRTPIWMFTAPSIRVPLSEVASIVCAEHTYGPLEALITGEFHLLGSTATWVEAKKRDGKSVRLMIGVTPAEAEFVESHLNAYLFGADET